jgi:hypothetical protein
MCDALIQIPKDPLKYWLAFDQGIALTPLLRRYMGARFGTDLSDVRVHTGAIVALLCTRVLAGRHRSTSRTPPGHIFSLRQGIFERVPYAVEAFTAHRSLPKG